MKIQTIARRFASFVAAAVVATMGLAGIGERAYATTADTIYSYTLTGSSSVVANDAAANSSAALTLVGDWSQSAFGTHFDGNLTTMQSGGYYKPATGNTIQVPATSAVGAAVYMQYQGPATGTCFSDSQNITQAGRFGANLGQIKLQLSTCSGSSTHVYPECRMAGSLTPNTVFPVRSTAALVSGNSYVIKCYKTPDPVTGNATLTMRVAKVDTVNGNTVTTDTFSISPTGAITSSAYLSVANKFALPSQATNTDQFVGDIAKVAYCQATTTTAVETCLATDVPEPAQILPVVTTTLGASPASVEVGQQTTYTATVANTQAGSVANGTALSVTVPSGMTITNAYGGTVSGNTVSWSIGTLNGSSSAAKQVEVQLVSGAVGATLTANATTTTTDTACSNSGSSCAASTGVTVAPSVTEWITNPGAETDLSGWGGTYGSSSLVSVTRNTAQSHTGTADILVTALTGANGAALGFNDSPRWVTSTVSGKTYTASAWVKPSFVSQKLNLRLREWSGSTLVTDQKVTLTAASTAWQQVTVDLTAAANGNQLSYAVYGSSMVAGDSFEVDDLSLTSN